jgi:hypothetical protein
MIRIPIAEALKQLDEQYREIKTGIKINQERRKKLIDDIIG